VPNILSQIVRLCCSFGYKQTIAVLFLAGRRRDNVGFERWFGRMLVSLIPCHFRVNIVHQTRQTALYPQPVYAKPVSPISGNRVLIVCLILFLLGFGTFGAMSLAAMAYYFSGEILPGVSAFGVSLGGMDVDQAANALTVGWATITVKAGERTVQVNPAQLGLSLDAQATARKASQEGRGQGDLIQALFGKTYIEPVLVVDSAKLFEGITVLAPQLEKPAQNATIRMTNGQLIPIAAVIGSKVDTAGTVARLTQSASAAFASGTLELATTTLNPTVIDATALLEKARTLLASPLTLNLYDPISNQTNSVSIPPSQWGAWLTTENTPMGVQFAVDKGALSTVLKAQSPGNGRTFDADQGAQVLNNALAIGQNTATVQIHYQPTQYAVQSGDTLTSIAWKIGIPYWRIARANPNANLDTLSVGQVITLPPKDANLEVPIIPNKRIVISISKQKMWAYENGQVKWDWAASTGITSSPTMPGVYQILSHEQTAYAGNWDLDMPFFMAIYDAVPGFSNGIHGMPTRNGRSVLWENALGRPVTYGCILLSNANARALYEWAQEGVVVEIQA